MEQGTAQPKPPQRCQEPIAVWRRLNDNEVKIRLTIDEIFPYKPDGFIPFTEVNSKPNRTALITVRKTGVADVERLHEKFRLILRTSGNPKIMQKAPHITYPKRVIRGRSPQAIILRGASLMTVRTTVKIWKVSCIRTFRSSMKKRRRGCQSPRKINATSYKGSWDLTITLN